jgi:hypothetical protein
LYIWAWGVYGNLYDNWPGAVIPYDEGYVFMTELPAWVEGFIISSEHGGYQTYDIWWHESYGNAHIALYDNWDDFFGSTLGTDVSYEFCWEIYTEPVAEPAAEPASDMPVTGGDENNAADSGFDDEPRALTQEQLETIVRLNPYFGEWGGNVWLGNEQREYYLTFNIDGTYEYRVYRDRAVYYNEYGTADAFDEGAFVRFQFEPYYGAAIERTFRKEGDALVLYANDNNMFFTVPMYNYLKFYSDISTADVSGSVYVYGTDRAEFLINPAAIREIRNPEDAKGAIAEAVQSMTYEQRNDPDALDDLAHYIEVAAREGTKERASSGKINIDPRTIGRLAELARDIHGEAERVLNSEGVNLLRNLRKNVTLESNEREDLTVAFEGGEIDRGIDRITVAAPFAGVTVERELLERGGEINITRIPQDGEDDISAVESGRRNTLTEELADSSPLRFWSAGIVPILLLIWLILVLLKKKIPKWIIPAASGLIILANAGLFAYSWLTAEIIPQVSRARVIQETREVAVRMSEGMAATLSLPVLGGTEYLVLANERGEIQPTKYNPVTDTVEARIGESGTYTIIENRLDFSDIERKNDIMKEAITQLASKGIMQGTEEGLFEPDKLITRAELVSAVIFAFDLLDFHADNPFSDVTRSDWFYAAAVSGAKVGIISGFEDGSFKGNLEMEKDQMVVAAANTLTGQMGYKTPMDIEQWLMRYLDREDLADWSEDGVALATRSNVLIYRADSLFAPKTAMTRGDAAIVLYRVFQKVW